MPFIMMLIVLAIMIFVKAKIVRIICAIIFLVLVSSLLSYQGVLPRNFNIIELFREWFGLVKVEGTFGG